MNELTFKYRLMQYILQHVDNNYDDNFSSQSGDVPAENVALFYVHRLPVSSFSRQDIDFALLAKLDEIVTGYSQAFQFLYELLEDEPSRHLLIALCAYRILGFKKVKLPSNNLFYWTSHKFPALLVEKASAIDYKQQFKLSVFNLHSIGIPIKLIASFDGIHCLFFLKQYEYEIDEKYSIQAKPGDVVIDGGACWGDSSIYFAECVGKTGKVFSIEFVESNIEIFEKNLALNPSLQNRVVLLKNALHRISHETLQYNDDGPGTTLFQEVGRPFSAKTISIDDLVEQNKLSRVDFIKMDIETSELSALKGAYHTLKRFKPKLAISAYHKVEDLTEIPAYLSSLDLGYHFYLKQATIHLGETVLFAAVL